jgi:hypothetical protein
MIAPQSFDDLMLPRVPDAANLIRAVIAAYPELASLSEPYRCAAHLLGWASADGGIWWSAVMDEIG